MGANDRYATPTDDAPLDENEREATQTIGYGEHGGESTYLWEGSPVAPFVNVVPWRNEATLYQYVDDGGHDQRLSEIVTGDIGAEAGLILCTPIDVKAWSTLTFLVSYVPNAGDQILELILEVSGSRRGDDDELWFPYVTLRDYADVVQQSPDGVFNSGFLARPLFPTTYRTPRLGDAVTPVVANVQLSVPYDITPFQRARLRFRESAEDAQTRIASAGDGQGVVTISYLLGT